MSNNKIFLIDEETLTNPVIKDQVFLKTKGRGYVPRDYKESPREMWDPPTSLTKIPRTDWHDIIQDKKANKSNISDILIEKKVPCLDQGSVGYCWGHSSVGAVMAARAIANQPTVPLSAYAVCATIKKGRDEGGWCGLSAKFIREKGVPSQKLWPQGDRNYTKYQNDNSIWADAELHKSTEEWLDITRDVYDVQLTFEQLATCLLVNGPCPVDFNWWGHSVLACDLVEIESNSFGILIRNSWGEGWGQNGGFGVLRDNKAVPNSALCIRTTTISPN